MIAECGDAHRLFVGCSLYFCAFDTHNSLVTAELVVLLVVVVTALAFDFTNGFHDTGNAMATSIATGALRPKVAVALSATLNLIGAFLSVEVAATVAKGVVNLGTVSGEDLLLIVFAGLVGGILWNLATWLFGMPSSSSHALFGGLIGAAIASIGMNGVEWGGVMGKVILPALLAPVVAALVAAVGTKLIYRITHAVPDDTKSKGFRIGQVGTASLVSLAHGTNDAQKTMGVIFLALVAHGSISPDADMPFWVKLSCAVAIALGTYLGGWRIIRTLGKGLVEISAPQGMAAESSSAAIILTSSHLGLPLSTTHVATGSILGTGLGRRGAEVRWGVAGRMAVAWLITLPSAGIVGAICWAIAHLIGGLPGVLVVFALLIGLSVVMYLRSRQEPIDPSNVNAEWDGGLTPAAETPFAGSDADADADHTTTRNT
ncbi:PiT family inorganic phosphate transporter [Rhodococcus sp. OK519]|nr:PiT family inorganic phosphate transporter [Rhodococcus sp. OK519]